VAISHEIVNLENDSTRVNLLILKVKNQEDPMLKVLLKEDGRRTKLRF
jgi:hypothetical protein